MNTTDIVIVTNGEESLVDELARLSGLYMTLIDDDVNLITSPFSVHVCPMRCLTECALTELIDHFRGLPWVIGELVTLHIDCDKNLNLCGVYKPYDTEPMGNQARRYVGSHRRAKGTDGPTP